MGSPRLDESERDAQRLFEQGKEKYLKEGYTCVQAESQPVEFRKIKVKN